MSNYTKTLTAKIVLVFFIFGYCISPQVVMAQEDTADTEKVPRKVSRKLNKAKSLFESGKSAYESGQSARAVKKLKKALQNDPSLYEAHKILGLAYKKENVLPESARVFRFTNLYKELDADDDELTRTRKLRRAFVEKRYETIVDALYTDVDNVHIDTTIKYEDGRESRINTDLAIRQVAE